MENKDATTAEEALGPESPTSSQGPRGPSESNIPIPNTQENSPNPPKEPKPAISKPVFKSPASVEEAITVLEQLGLWQKRSEYTGASFVAVWDGASVLAVYHTTGMGQANERRNTAFIQVKASKDMVAKSCVWKGPIMYLPHLGIVKASEKILVGGKQHPEALLQVTEEHDWAWQRLFDKTGGSPIDLFVCNG